MKVKRETVSRWVGEAEAALYCGVSPSLLTRLRTKGPISDGTLGPPFIKMGMRALYLLDDLDAWLKPQRRIWEKETPLMMPSDEGILH